MEIDRIIYIYIYPPCTPCLHTKMLKRLDFTIQLYSLLYLVLTFMYTNIAMDGFYDTILSCLELALDICKNLDIAELSHTILKFPDLDPKMH